MFKDDFRRRYTTIPFAVYRGFSSSRYVVIAHQHKEIELIAMTEGMADIYIDGARYRVEKGDTLVIPPYSIHRVETMSDKITAYNCICFDLELLWDEELRKGLTNHLLSFKHLISKESPISNQIQACIDEGCTACEKNESGWEMCAIGNMSLIFASLKAGGYFEATVSVKSENTFAQNVMDYIADNYMSQITSKGISDALYMNNSYFCRAFKKTFGYCFSEYLLAYRLEKAKVYLINTNLSVTDISFKMGFNSCSYFGKVFRERFGISPLSYRKVNEKQK